MIKEMRDLLTAAAVAGAVVALAVPAMAQGLIVQLAPPALEVETPPPMPGPEAVWTWRAGYWRWDGTHYDWVRGHYIQRIHPGAVWVSGHWVARPDGYVWMEGHWR